MKGKAQLFKNRAEALALRLITTVAAVLTAGILLSLVVYILVMGIPHLSPRLFEFTYNSENVSMFPAIVNTALMVILTLLIAVPVGIFSAIYLVEYAKRGSKLVAVVRMTAETLSGIPSIVYGLFGYLMFVITLKWDYSFLAGSLTLAMMILPTIMRTSEEALKSVPDSYREGSFGLGAGRLRTVFSIILPSAMQGILSGVILGIGRIVGETAALMFTAGTIAKIPENLMASGRTLAVHMYALLSEGLHMEEAYATAVILLLLVMLINGLSSLTAKLLTRTKGN